MRTTVLFALCVFSVGCGGRLILSQDDADAGVSAPPPALAGSCDRAGALACNGDGQKLQLLCDGTKWVSNGVCAGAQICDSRAGATRGSCQDPLADCAAHGAGSTFCDGAVRKTCSADLLSTTDVDCGTFARCAAGTGTTCGTCGKDEHTCEGAYLFVCKNGAFVKEKYCLTAVNCDAVAGVCKDTICIPGEFRCDGKTLQQCDINGTALQTISNCAVSCNAGEKRCDPCPAGTGDCVGDVPRTCGDSGTWSVGTACDPGMCVDGVCGGSPPPPPSGCTASTYRCSGDTLQICSSDGSAWSDVTTCPSGTCNAATKTCTGTTCSVGARDCSGSTPRYCDDTGHWATLADCVSPAICVAGKCATASAVEVYFPSKTSKTYDGAGTSGPYWPTASFHLAGAFIEESYPRTADVYELALSATMHDMTLGSSCAGQVLSWDVFVNTVKVGSFSWTTTGTDTHVSVNQKWLFPAISPSVGSVTLHVQSTTSVTAGCGAWNWDVPGVADMP